MNNKTVLFAAISFYVMVCPAYADWSVSKTGTWPETWPVELEPLRKQSRTLQGSQLDLTFHEIAFKSREDFEAAWPHILKIKTKGVPITLLRSPHEYLGTLKAGVRIWHPAYKTRNLWLVVDGEIVDLNRILLPADTPIIDERFKDEHPGRRRAERSKEGGNSLAVNDIENKDAIASFSSIHNVDGWSREELAQQGISIAPWKHELQTEHPPRNWIQVSFARAHVPRSQPMISTSCQSSSGILLTRVRISESECSRLSGSSSSVSSSIRSNRNGIALCRALH